MLTNTYVVVIAIVLNSGTSIQDHGPGTTATIFVAFLSPPGKFRNSTLNETKTASTPFLNHYSLMILQLDALCS
jgi:hypothetical protein